MSSKKNTLQKFVPLPSLPPPSDHMGIRVWFKKNLFYSKFNIFISLFFLGLVLYIIENIIYWLVIDADWIGEDRSACRRVGACWIFIGEKWNLFLYGFYPQEEHWRPQFIGILFFIFLIPFFIKRFKFKKQWLFIFLFLYPLIAFSFIHGFGGLPVIRTSKWGGLMLTLLVGYMGILASFPIGVILGLGRSSDLPVARFFSVIFIEFWRGVPLITILFMSSNIFPLFVPEDLKFDKTLRALIGVTLFQSAYIAEVIRGGLQGIPKGQHEASDSLGLPYWYKVFYIILPQAIRIVIPSIAGASISLFKDTTLLLIIGLFDVLAIVQLASQDTSWIGFETEGYVFVGVLFWIFCYSMSRYSFVLENKFSLNQGDKK